MNRANMEERSAHVQPRAHVCGSLVPIILLGFFSHYYNYSANNSLIDCWTAPDTGIVSPIEVSGYTNVT